MFVPCTMMLYDSTAATRTLKLSTNLLSISCGIRLIFLLMKSYLVCGLFSQTVFQVLPQKIVRWVEILGIGWSGVIGLMRIESVPWKAMPEVFKCSVQEMRWVYCWRNEAPPHFLNRTVEYLRHSSPWDRLTLHQTKNPGTSYSQDLNPPDYFLRECLKDRVCENNP